MNQSHVFDPDLHEAGGTAARGQCSYHSADGVDAADGAGGPCAGDAVVSFQDRDGRWQSGCSLALEQLVEQGEIEPLGQGG
jgi:hypothetical protein